MDIDELREDADIEAVVDALGLETFPSGSNIFLYCPNPDHNDRHPTNCYFKRGWNHVYCTVCGKTFNAIDIIMWQTGAGFSDAVRTLAKIQGISESELDRQKRKSKGDRPEISNRDLRYLGAWVPSFIEEPMTETQCRMAASQDMPRELVEDRNSISYIISRKRRIRPTETERRLTIREHIRIAYQENLRKRKKLRKAGIDDSFLEKRERKIIDMLKSLESKERKDR
jgi:DNA primase